MKLTNTLLGQSASAGWELYCLIGIFCDRLKALPAGKTIEVDLVRDFKQMLDMANQLYPTIALNQTTGYSVICQIVNNALKSADFHNFLVSQFCLVAEDLSMALSNIDRALIKEELCGALKNLTTFIRTNYFANDHLDDTPINIVAANRAVTLKA